MLGAQVNVRKSLSQKFFYIGPRLLMATERKVVHFFSAHSDTQCTSWEFCNLFLGSLEVLNPINHVILGNVYHRIFDWQEYENFSCPKYGCLFQISTELVSFKVNRGDGSKAAGFLIFYVFLSTSASFLLPV